jgi:hypothetical protein
MKTVANQYNVHPGFVREEHKINNVSTRSPEDKAKATQQFNNVENLLKSYPERNVGKFFNPGGLEQGVHALAAAENVMLSTGFNVEEGMPETDGPPGLAALAHALILCGKTVTFVADSKNNELVRNCLAEFDKDAAERCKFEDFNVRPDAAHVPENAEEQTTDQATKLRKAELKAEKKAQDLLDQHKPDVFLSLELNGRGDSGYAKNMRGKVITGWNSMSDEVLNQANAKGVTTIAVGDGGNEAGMGELDNIPNAMDGKPMQARTQAGIQVTSWNSNFGGEALAYGLLASYGKLRDKVDGGGNIVAGAGCHSFAMRRTCRITFPSISIWDPARTALTRRMRTKLFSKLISSCWPAHAARSRCIRKPSTSFIRSVFNSKRMRPEKIFWKA